MKTNERSEAESLVTLLENREWKQAGERMAILPDEATLLTSRNQTSLHVACVRKAPLEVIVALIDTFPEAAKVADTEGRLPLHCLCRFHTYTNTHDAIGSLLKAHPAAAKSRDAGGSYPLHIFVDHCRGGKNLEDELATVKILVEASDCLMCSDVHGNTALHRSCSSRMVPEEVTRLLVERTCGRTASAVNGYGQTPLQSLCRTSDSSLSSILDKERGGSLNNLDDPVLDEPQLSSQEQAAWNKARILIQAQFDTQQREFVGIGEVDVRRSPVPDRDLAVNRAPSAFSFNTKGFVSIIRSELGRMRTL